MEVVLSRVKEAAVKKSVDSGHTSAIRRARNDEALRKGVTGLPRKRGTEIYIPRPKFLGGPRLKS